MSILIHIPSGFQTPEFEIMLARTQAEIDKGEDVIVVGCRGGGQLACSFNVYAIAPLCSVCNSQRQRGLSHLKGKFTYLDGAQPSLLETSVGNAQEAIKDRWTIKALMYRSVDVGQAAYSSYIGSTRDLNLDGVLAVRTIRKLLCTSEGLADYFYQLIPEQEVSRVVLFNGRQNQSRPLLRVAQRLGIPAEVLEATGRHARCVFKFENSLPQHLTNLADKIERNWEKYQGDREAEVSQYYSYIRHGGPINDYSFVRGQREGLLPKEWDSRVRNIVIFNSSEDELAALGGEYDEVLYPSQFEAISRICESLAHEKKIHIYLRVHPNLAKVKWKFSVALSRLSTMYSNVVVISPNSPISSYALLDACDVVVSFGSTIGIEAAYWGKPSILIGRGIYEKTGSVYVPHSHEELIKMLKDRSMGPLSNLGAKKVALFWSKGGEGIEQFGGSRDTGFTFAGQRISKSLIERAVYAMGKGIDRWILGDFINYRVGLWWGAVKRWTKVLNT